MSYLNRFYMETHITYTINANSHAVSYIMIGLYSLILMLPRKKGNATLVLSLFKGIILARGYSSIWMCTCFGVCVKTVRRYEKRVMCCESSRWQSRQHGSCLPTGLKTLQKKTGSGVEQRWWDEGEMEGGNPVPWKLAGVHMCKETGKHLIWTLINFNVLFSTLHCRLCCVLYVKQHRNCNIFSCCITQEDFLLIIYIFLINMWKKTLRIIRSHAHFRR